MDKPKIFISWSGELSRKCAELIKEFVGTFLYTTDPFLSCHDIGAGAIWFSRIKNELTASSTGIVCLTKENLSKPWILFEAGALANGLAEKRVMTVLIDITNANIEDPLAQFNHTNITDRVSMRKLLGTICDSLDESVKPNNNAIDSYVASNWEKFSEAVQMACDDSKSTDERDGPLRSQEEKVDEILSRIRNLDRRVERINTSNHARFLRDTDSLTSDRGLRLRTLDDSEINPNEPSVSMIKNVIKLLDAGVSITGIMKYLGRYGFSIYDSRNIIGIAESQFKLNKNDIDQMEST